MSGVAACNARVFGEPKFVPMVMMDHAVGLIATQCILAALFHREKTGEAQAIEVPMFENAATFVMVEHLGDHTFVPPLGDWGDRRVLDPLAQPIATKRRLDRGVRQHRRPGLCVVRRDRPAGTEDRSEVQFGEGALRQREGVLLDPRRGAEAARPPPNGSTMLEEADVPAGRVHTMESLIEDEHLADVGLFRKIDHPTEGTKIELNNPNKFSAGLRNEQTPAPFLGGQSVEILSELGYGQAEIDAMLAAKATLDGAEVGVCAPAGSIMGFAAASARCSLPWRCSVRWLQAQQRALDRDLIAAGFVMRPPIRPAKCERLQRHRRRTALRPAPPTAQRYYIYADPSDCNCAFVGYAEGVRHLSRHAQAAAAACRACRSSPPRRRASRLHENLMIDEMNEDAGLWTATTFSTLQFQLSFARAGANKNPASRRGFAFRAMCRVTGSCPRSPAAGSGRCSTSNSRVRGRAGPRRGARRDHADAQRRPRSRRRPATSNCAGATRSRRDRRAADVEPRLTDRDVAVHVDVAIDVRATG